MADNEHDHDHHDGHDKAYIKMWAILLVLLVISILGPELGIKIVTLITAFGIAFVKAYLVCANFMHLKSEGKVVLYMLATMFMLMIVLLAGFAPDIYAHEGSNWYKKSVTLEEGNYGGHDDHGAHGDSDKDAGHDDKHKAGDDSESSHSKDEAPAAH